MKPEWIIYKNEQRIGQALTWYKAIDILIKQEKCTYLEIIKYSKYVSIRNKSENSQTYKIVQER